MEEFFAALRRVLEQTGEFWSSLNGRGRATLAAAAAVALTAIAVFVWRSNAHDFRPLYSNLDAQEAGRIVARLEALQTPYRLAPGGSAVLVPQEDLDRLRLQLASEGLPQTGRLGFELFDEPNFGATEFAERVNFQRALEGELERTIASLAEVDQARAHITLPKRSVFLARDEPAKASIVVRLRGGAGLSREQTRAIEYLVASAVEGLSPEGVAVMDQSGRLFTNRVGVTDDLSDRQLEFRRSLERDAVNRILATLEPRLGPGGVRANVAIDVDWNSGEQTRELVDPNPIVVNRQVTQESASRDSSSGAPGTASNLPRNSSTPQEEPTAGAQRSSETTNYQTSRTVTHTTLERGDIERMSIAVLVDYEASPDGRQGGMIRRPREAAELATVRNLVIAASGARLDRGDTVTVESLPFSMLDPAPSGPEQPLNPADEWFSLDWLRVHRIQIIFGAIGAAGLIGLGTWLKRRHTAAQVRIERQKALEAERERKQLAQQAAAEHELRRAEEERMLQGLKISTEQTGKTAVLRRHLEDVATESPDRFARLVRTWMKEDD